MTPEVTTPEAPLARETLIPIAHGKKDAKHQLRVLRFGPSGGRPKAVLQAGLHADELPGMLVLRLLAEMLEAEAARGGLLGEIVLIPCANPIGLSQRKGEALIGRADLKTDQNFNRGFPDLALLTRKALKGKLGDDVAANVAVIRAAFADALAAHEPDGRVGALQLMLLKEAADADLVLDLHADNEAQMHLYTLPQLWEAVEPLAAELDARAVLLCEDSGGSSFDEACSTPWVRLAGAYPDAAIPSACLSATVELRSNNELDEKLAARDARALLRFLMRRGLVAGEPGVTPRLLCKPTPLEGMQPLKAPIEGLVIYRRQLGDTVRAGEVVAEIVPLSGDRVPLVAGTEGLLFARHNQPWAWEGKTIAKIAGEVPLPERIGDLMSP
jgi:predicted deacylase